MNANFDLIDAKAMPMISLRLNHDSSVRSKWARTVSSESLVVKRSRPVSIRGWSAYVHIYQFRWFHTSQSSIRISTALVQSSTSDGLLQRHTASLYLAYRRKAICIRGVISVTRWEVNYTVNKLYSVCSFLGLTCYSGRFQLFVCCPFAI